MMNDLFAAHDAAHAKVADLLEQSEPGWYEKVCDIERDAYAFALVIAATAAPNLPDVLKKLKVLGRLDRASHEFAALIESILRDMKALDAPTDLALAA
jgi:hypothetical protein